MPSFSLKPLAAAFTSRLYLWCGIFLFILYFLHPELIILDSPPTGGDTSGHFTTLAYLVDHVLPQGRLVGWMPGNYAGFPLFQMYFPGPFVLMALLGLVMPLTVAFKIVSLAGVFGLPLSVFSFLRNLGYDEPAGDLGALFSLAFLFMEANSAWGGNITSTLAGEFTYGIGLCLSLVYLGRLYRDITSGRRVVSNAILLALIGFSHGYPLIFAVIGAGFFLLTTKQWLHCLAYILEVNLLAFGLMGFWILPLLWFTPYTTPFNFVWIIESWREVFPEILWPFIIPGLLGLVFTLFKRSESFSARHRTLFLIYLIILGVVFYFIGFKIGLVDIRFLPFTQIFLVMAGATAVGRILTRERARAWVVLGLALGVLVWCVHHQNHIEPWAAWNYSGWQSKKLWPAYKGLAEYLAGDFSDPRVVYEHGAITNDAGTVRAFESLPYFSGRATLEGLYIQASLASPFVFHLQSEVSQAISAPLRTYNYGRFDLDRARGHLELFNVNQYITVTPAARQAALDNPNYLFEKNFPPFTVFRLRDARERYVVQPVCRPVLAITSDPKQVSFDWFRRGILEIPLVVSAKVAEEEKSLFADVLSGEEIPALARRLPCLPTGEHHGLAETVMDEEIIIENAVIGEPLWIRISYHPGWKVEGADKIWRTAPCFMMVFPRQSRVRLHFGPGIPDYLGLGLTVLGCFYVLYHLIRHRFWPPEGAYLPLVSAAGFIFGPLIPFVRARARLVLGIFLTAGSIMVFLFILAVGYDEPVVYFNRGYEYFQNRDYDGARRVFSKAIRRFPLSPAIDQTIHHLALSYYNQGRYDKALGVWSDLTRNYPESRLVAEAYYHLALCQRALGNLSAARSALAEVLILVPPSAWTDRAEKLLAELEKNNP